MKNVHKWLPQVILLFGVIFFTPGNSIGQSYASRSELKKEIHLTDELLNETLASEEKSITELLLLSTQIGLREKYLDQLKKEIIQQNEEIGNLNLEICQLESDIHKIKEEYAQTARITYKGFDPENFWLSLFSSENVSEAYYRTVYFRQFSQYRKKQVEQLIRTKTFLANKVYQLQESVNEKAALIEEYGTEEKKVEKTRTKQKQVYHAIRPREEQINKTKVTQKEEIKDKIQHSEKMISFAAAENAPEKKSETYAEAFLKSKGSIPWPIPQAQAIITEHFGKSEDPYGNQIINDGIYFSTRQGQKVRAVFTGKVTGVQKLPLEGGYVVIVEHGNYRTVYANLASSDVEVDQMVTQNQELGTVKTDRRTGETLLNFLIYKYPDQFDDPEKWIMKK
ncbi:MAG: peptidoglycan DD-metalloendopeptidase family protein [Bacteroidetes bacterium]|nr:peptidoglycan DD-metalloendopeptidase family protein [Bacteroidota bacterium]